MNDIFCRNSAVNRHQMNRLAVIIMQSALFEKVLLAQALCNNIYSITNNNNIINNYSNNINITIIMALHLLVCVLIYYFMIYFNSKTIQVFYFRACAHFVCICSVEVWITVERSIVALNNGRMKG
jgi:hypothetical protein